MATKNNPGKFDCFAAADPDEPMFILLGRDPIAPFLVGWWVGLKSMHDPSADPAKLQEAMQVAKSMEEWLTKLNREDKIKLRNLINQEGMRIAALLQRDLPNEESVTEEVNQQFPVGSGG
jgi:hypothetical protein